MIYYQHFQIDLDEFDSIAPGEATSDGHIWVEDVAAWQTDFAHAVIDAGASIYVGHGHRAFDGIEIYKGKPLIRQLGGLAYQGLHPEVGYYDDYRPWEGLLAELTTRNGAVVHIELTPLDLDEGETYRADYDADSLKSPPASSRTRYSFAFATYPPNMAPSSSLPTQRAVLNLERDR